MKHGRTKARRDRQYLFERCMETWLSDSPETALRMLAAHIGGLRHDLDEVRRELRQVRRDEDRPRKRRGGGKETSTRRDYPSSQTDRDRGTASHPERKIYRSSTWPVLPIATVTVTSVQPSPSRCETSEASDERASIQKFGEG